MKKAIKVILWILAVSLLLHLTIVLTNNTHLYPTLRHTIFEGRLGPHILEYTKFPRDTIRASNRQELPTAENANSYQLTPKDLELFDKYKTEAFLVIKNDSIQFEYYNEGWKPEIASNSFSMAKTFVSVLVGCAISDGYIESVEQPVGDFIPKFARGNNGRLKLKHLLTMSVGMNFDEHYINPFAFPARANYGKNLEELVLSYDVTSDPGQVFEYRSGATQLLVLVLEQATGKPFSQYFEERLWQQIGATQDAYWSTDNNGLPKGFCCLNSNARDFARLGQLYLDSGKWKGKAVVPKSYVAQSIQPAPLKEIDSSVCTRYGYSWWLTEVKGKEVFYARGILGQYVFVIPSEDLVVVRLGHKRAVSSMLKDPKDIQDYLSIALNINALVT